MSFLPIASFIPELIRAKVSAGLMFKMIEEPTRIDNMSDKGLKPASSFRKTLTVSASGLSRGYRNPACLFLLSKPETTGIEELHCQGLSWTDAGPGKLFELQR